MHTIGKTGLTGACLVLCCVLMGCGGGNASAFTKHRAAAERAYAAGRYAESAQHWHQAARSTKRVGLQRKAQYREALSALKAGADRQAETLLTALASEKSPFAARAQYDLALLDLERGNREAALNRLRQLIVSSPHEAIAPGALRRYLKIIESDQGLLGALQATNELLSRLQKTTLAEPLRYERAHLLAELGQDDAALAAYLEVANLHPYPRGAHWDDALWHAALLEERLGRPESAIERLRRMLRTRESADFAGSYERPRYAQAHFHLAELLRDRLHDPERARIEFERLYKQYPTSRLRDDALWEAAKISHQRGNDANACALMRTLRAELSESRYGVCAALLCSELTTPSGARCPPYIERTVSSQ